MVDSWRRTVQSLFGPHGCNNRRDEKRWSFSRCWAALDTRGLKQPASNRLCCLQLICTAVSTTSEPVETYRTEVLAPPVGTRCAFQNTAERTNPFCSHRRLAVFFTQNRYACAAQGAIKNCFIRGSVVRYIQIPSADVDTELLQDACRKESAQGK